MIKSHAQGFVPVRTNTEILQICDEGYWLQRAFWIEKRKKGFSALCIFDVGGDEKKHCCSGSRIMLNWVSP